MKEDKSLLIKFAMNLGFIFGGYWCLKYLFLMLGAYWTSSVMIYWCMSLTVPFLAYRLTTAYRKSALGGRIGFYHAWQFGVLLYFFAAILVALLHYVFYEYIAPKGFLESIINEAAGLMKGSNVDEKVLDQVKSMKIPSSIELTFQDIFYNIFYGMIFSIPVAWIAKKKSV